jgi:hypothetical protein
MAALQWMQCSGPVWAETRGVAESTVSPSGCAMWEFTALAGADPAMRLPLRVRGSGALPSRDRLIRAISANERYRF